MQLKCKQTADWLAKRFWVFVYIQKRFSITDQYFLVEYAPLGDMKIFYNSYWGWYSQKFQWMILGSLHVRFLLTTAPPKYSKFATTLISILSIHCIWMLSIHILSYGYRKFFLIILLELKTWSWTETAFQSCFILFSLKCDVIG